MRPLSSPMRTPASSPLLLLLLLLFIVAHVGEAQANARGLPTAIRKMSPDAGEKLFQEYLAFAEEDQVADVATQAQQAMPAPGSVGSEGEDDRAINSSASIPYYAPFAPHFSNPGLGDRRRGDTSDEEEEVAVVRSRWDVVGITARLEKRQYACPTGTSNCSSIGYPDSCCQAGTECVQITDTGLGPVGCCPDGISCSGSIACSGSQEGCPSDIGGGCCIEGYVCDSIGCK